MIDPRTVMIAAPCYDGKVMSELCGALVSSQGLYLGLSLPTECSNVSLVRNLIAAQFLASHFEWLVCIDSDIVPQRRDLEILLQPCDLEQVYLEEVEEGRKEAPAGAALLPPRPSRISTALVIDQEPGKPVDYTLKTVGAADLLVCAQYSYKNDLMEPVQLGMGFTRIHRSVFELLQKLTHEPGETVEVSRTAIEVIRVQHEAKRVMEDDMINHLLNSVQDKAGTSRLWQASHQGRTFYDYFPTGPIISTFVPTGDWKGEDHGFFTLCMLAGLVPRIETRTRLLHVGRKAYPYFGPDSGAGQ